MDLIDVIRMLRRQRYIVVAGIVAILLSAVIIRGVVPTTYEASGRVVFLLPPESAGRDKLTNPYLNLDANMTLTASLVASSLTTEQSLKALHDAGFTSDLSLALPPEVGPVLDVKARDTDGAMAVRTRDEVVRRIDEKLASMQSDVSAPSYQTIYTRTVATPSEAEAVPGAKMRALSAVGALIVVATLVVCALRDRRRPGIEATAAPDEAGNDDAPPDGEPAMGGQRPKPRSGQTRPRGSAKSRAQRRRGGGARPGSDGTG